MEATSNETNRRALTARWNLFLQDEERYIARDAFNVYFVVEIRFEVSLVILTLGD